MEPRELLESLVAVVVTLGEVAATVAGPYGDVLLAVSPRALHTALETFISHLQDTLGHHSVTSLDHDGVTSLGEALSAFRDKLGATWVHVTNAASAWRVSVAVLEDSWARLAREATELRDACRDTATREATTAAAATTLAGDLQDKDTRWQTSLHNLVTEAWQLPTHGDKEKAASEQAAREARLVTATKGVEAATKAWGDAVVDSSKGEAAATREQKAKAALGPLERLVASCDEATAFPRELQRRLGDIEAALKGTNEASPNVPEALVAMVANAERLWEASARLARLHLLRTLGDIRTLLSSTPGGPGGLSGRVEAEQCQKAIEDIPRLLRGQ